MNLYFIRPNEDNVKSLKALVYTKNLIILVFYEMRLY